MRPIQLLGEQVHQQAVVPPAAVSVALVVAKHADGTKSHGGVAPDRRFVVSRGVDREAMMAAVMHEVARQDPHSVSPDAPAVHGGVESDVY